MDSILLTIKTLLGGAAAEDTEFNTDIIININSAFSILHQLGLGPKRGFKITGDSEVWEDFLGNKDYLEDVKTYVYLKTRLVFDPPSNSFLTKSIEDQIKELEWRLNVAQETPAIEEEE